MKYKVDKKRTLLFGKEKILGGKAIPAGIIKKIGEQGVKSLLRDGAIKEVDKNESVKVDNEVDNKAEEKIKPAIEPEAKEELEDFTRDELFKIAEEKGIYVPARSSKGELIEAIKAE